MTRERLEGSLKMPPKIKQKHKRSVPVLRIVMATVLVLYTASLFVVLLWGVMTSFKGVTDFEKNKLGLPSVWYWNFTYVFKKFKIVVTTTTEQKTITMGQMYLHSILYAFGCAFFQTLVTCCTAYICARYRYKFSRLIHTVVVVTMFIPVVGNLVSEMQIAAALGLYNRIWGMWIMSANFLGIYFLVFYEAVRSLPAALFEAAKIDGASHTGLMLRIAFPLLRNLFFTVLLINFIRYWNEYQIPAIYLAQKPTIAFGMYYLGVLDRGDTMSTVPMRMTTAVMVVAPLLVIFLLTHKKLLGNLTVGGVK